MTNDRSRLSAFLWLAVDSIFAIFLIGVLVASFWRGTWSLLDLVAPDDPALSIWVCVAVGNCGLLAASLLQEPLEKWEERLSRTSSGRIAAFVFRRVYSYVLGCYSVCQWRGLWKALDHYVGLSDISFTLSVVVGQSLLMIFRSSKIVSGTPVGHDSGAGFYAITSRFQQKPSRLGLYILDHLFTVVFLWNCVALVWRGVWGLADNHLYADDLQKTSWASFFIGIGVMLVTIPLQMVANLLYDWIVAKEMHSTWKILLEDLVMVVVSCGTIIHWRGVWYLENIYLLPEHRNSALSPAVSQVTGYAGLCLLLVSMSNAGVGSYITGNAPSKSGCLVNNGYFRFFLSVSPYDEEDDLDGQNNRSIRRSGSFRRNETRRSSARKSSNSQRKSEGLKTYGSFSCPM